LLRRYPAPEKPAEAQFILSAGEHWTFVPPEGHRLAWIALDRGALETGDLISAGELAIYDDGDAPLSFVALPPWR
jgi:hypothetical protein